MPKDYLSSWSIIIEIFSVLKNLNIRDYRIESDRSIAIRFSDQATGNKSLYQLIAELETVLDTKLELKHVQPDKIRLFPLTPENTRCYQDFIMSQAIYN